MIFDDDLGFEIIKFLVRSGIHYKGESKLLFYLPSYCMLLQCLVHYRPRTLYLTYAMILYPRRAISAAYLRISKSLPINTKEAVQKTCVYPFLLHL
jgi:hypothetical protein